MYKSEETYAHWTWAIQAGGELHRRGMYVLVYEIKIRKGF